MDQLIEFINANMPGWVMLVLGALGALVVAGSTYVALTPTQDDDKWWAALESKPVIGHIMKFLVRFSPIYRKEKKAEEPKQ